MAEFCDLTLGLPADLPCKVQVRVQPRAKKCCLSCEGEILKVFLNTPPVDGKANEALVVFLAKHWGIAKSRIRILRGETNRNKLLEILPEF